jgi:hypothetical protein
MKISKCGREGKWLVSMEYYSFTVVYEDKYG